jgi:hypothetical protein
MLSAMTLDQLGAKMRCDKCGKRPERYYPANQSDTPGPPGDLTKTKGVYAIQRPSPAPQEMLIISEPGGFVRSF